jgi:hypothetical protein
MSLQKQKITLIFSLILAFSLPFFVSARGLVPCGGIGENPCNVKDIFSLIAKVTNWLIFVAGIYAVAQIILNGFYMVVSMGNEEAISKRKSGLTDAVIGFILVMVAYILINTAVNSILLAGAPCELKVNITNPLGYLTNTNSCPTK